MGAAGDLRTEILIVTGRDDEVMCVRSTGRCDEKARERKELVVTLVVLEDLIWMQRRMWCSRSCEDL